MMTTSVQIQGLSELLNKFKTLGIEGQRTASAIIQSAADNIVADAKINAPEDLGTIRQNIGKETLVNTAEVIKVAIISAAPESAFQEFGTGGRVDVPAEMADVAATFQGKHGGDFAAFILALTDWVRRKGLTGVYSVATHKRSNAAQYGGKSGNDVADQQAAYLIARSILRNGLPPRPFLYPALVKGRTKLLPDMQKGFDALLAKYNS